MQRESGDEGEAAWSRPGPYLGIALDGSEAERYGLGFWLGYESHCGFGHLEEPLVV